MYADFVVHLQSLHSFVWKGEFVAEILACINVWTQRIHALCVPGGHPSYHVSTLRTPPKHHGGCILQCTTHTEIDVMCP